MDTAGRDNGTFQVLRAFTAGLGPSDGQTFPRLAAMSRGESTLPVLLGKRRPAGRAWTLAGIWLGLGMLGGLALMALPMTALTSLVVIFLFVGSIAAGAVAVAMVRRLVFDRAVGRWNTFAGVVVFALVFALPMIVVAAKFGGHDDLLNAQFNHWLTTSAWLMMPLIGMILMMGAASAMALIALVGEMIGSIVDRYFKKTA